VATPFFVRTGAFAAVAAVAALLALVLAGPAKAEGPGFWSDPAIASGSADVGSTLLGDNGAINCDPGCIPAGDDPSQPGIYYEWVSCTGTSSGGSDRPAGGMVDNPAPAPGCERRQGPSKDGSANTYTVRAEDAGRYIQLHVIATNYDCSYPRSDGWQECRYSSGHGYSKTIGPVGGSAAPPPPPPPTSGSAPPNMTAYPTTSGLAKEGSTITAANGSWTGAPTSFAYQWKRCAPEFAPCTVIPGASGSTYVLTPDDVGQRVQVLVTASNAKGSNAAASFPTDVVATSAVAPANTALPTISGFVEDRQRLTVSPGTWTGTQPIAFAYQWLRCSTSLDGCAPIPGATGPTYAVGRDDLGNRLLVTVTATNRGGTATATSARTGHVGAAKPRPGGDRLAIEDVTAPNGLVFAEVSRSRASVRPRGTLTLTVRITDRRGFKIEGARVTVTGPRGAVLRGVTVATDGNGLAVIRVRAGAKLPKGKLVLTLRVTKPGDSAVTGTKRIAVAVAIKR
jgi:hypothetical protein